MKINLFLPSQHMDLLDTSDVTSKVLYKSEVTSKVLDTEVHQSVDAHGLRQLGPGLIQVLPQPRLEPGLTLTKD